MTMKRLVAHTFITFALMIGANAALAQDSADEPALQTAATRAPVNL